MKIGMISVTLNAVPPMLQTLRESGFREVQNYLDEGLQALVQAEGAVTSKSLCRMVALIERAVQDGAEAIVLTCTVFTPYWQRLQALFTIPLFSADGVMLEQVAALNQKTAILCTFPASIKSSLAVFKEAAARQGTMGDADAFLLEDAARAIGQGNKPLHDSLIARKADSLGSEYKAVVLAQISMAQAAALVQNKDTKVYTSPASIVRELKKMQAL